MVKKAGLNILIICIFLLCNGTFAQKKNPFSLGFQFNIGFNSLPERDFYIGAADDSKKHCIPVTFAMEGGYKDIWFAKLKLTNLSNAAWKVEYSDRVADYDEFINLIHLSVGYNFFHNYYPEHFRLSFACGPYFEKASIDHVSYGADASKVYKKQKIYTGLEMTYRHEVGKNFALGLEADYGRVKDFNKVFSSEGETVKVFCIAVLLSYSIRPR